MANDHPREPDNRGARPEDEAALSARLRGLGERLNQVRGSRPQDTEVGARTGAEPSAIARGLRLSAELVAGVLVGAGLGWFIDRWLGSSPWGLFVFLMLGFTAGVLNVLRSAGLMSGGFPDSAAKDKDAD